MKSRYESAKIVALDGRLCHDEHKAAPKTAYRDYMNIHLKPELEQLIHKDVERGPYETADEFVERAVEMLHAQEEWLSANRTEISAKIEEGDASFQPVELLDGVQPRVQRVEQKRG